MQSPAERLRLATQLNLRDEHFRDYYVDFDRCRDIGAVLRAVKHCPHRFRNICE